MPHITKNLVIEEALPYFYLHGHCHLYEGASTETGGTLLQLT